MWPFLFKEVSELQGERGKLRGERVKLRDTRYEIRDTRYEVAAILHRVSALSMVPITFSQREVNEGTSDNYQMHISLLDLFLTIEDTESIEEEKEKYCFLCVARSASMYSVVLLSLLTMRSER